ncbi:EF-hand calcium-binding domain-containing protein 1, partial [Gryllus bimaculatus]
CTDRDCGGLRVGEGFEALLAKALHGLFVALGVDVPADDRGAEVGKLLGQFAPNAMAGADEPRLKVYDIMGDGYMIKETMYNLMHKALVKSPGDEDVEEGVRKHL